LRALAESLRHPDRMLRDSYAGGIATRYRFQGNDWLTVVLSEAKDLIAACHGHEILRFASARGLPRAR
jgi:hypothetical protein